MMRFLPVIIVCGLGLVLASCTSPAPTTVSADSPVAPPEPKPEPAAKPVNESAADVVLRLQTAKLAEIRREYENCKDTADYVRMMKLARVRRTELDAVIRLVQRMKLSPAEHERVLNPLRQERDWHLEVIQAAAAM